MANTQSLPRIDSFMHLVEVAGPFPITAWEVAEMARRYGFEEDTQHFIELFPEDEVFESREDLATRSEELIMLMREEARMDEEGPLSSQD
ncbi:MAG TPA: hypothetical protein VFH99_02345 [Candidatus Saccharimonadales bacterium]|nr:hypothetical protein [Candidatus Saccharimonadales bacterium]